MEQTAKEKWVENFIREGKYTSGDAAYAAFNKGEYEDSPRPLYHDAMDATGKGWSYPSRSFFRDVARNNLGLYNASQARFKDPQPVAA